MTVAPDELKTRFVVPSAAPLNRAACFRQELLSPDLTFLMEAHDGLSAKVAQEAGFKAIWASGLSISAALGVRDSNEASWTQVLDVVEFMTDAVSVPILLDGDTGYGNFNSVRRLVRKLCQRGVAAVCLEDKLFPKSNSFLGDCQPLADMDEFSGKIRAGKDSQTDPDFVIVARTEALVSGRGLGEALRRAEAYHAAGADAILIHSKAKTGDEVLAFAAEWSGRCPLVLVPTTYYRTSTARFREAGISMVIWANHNLRAALAAMRKVSRRIMAEESLAGIEDEIASIQDVFALTGESELALAERFYLPARAEDTGEVEAAAAPRRAAA
jgi:phosphoenolpyruvate phosphomutase